MLKPTNSGINSWMIFILFDRFDADSIGILHGRRQRQKTTTTKKSTNKLANYSVLVFHRLFVGQKKYKHRFGWYRTTYWLFLLYICSLLVTFSHTFGICLAFFVSSTEFQFYFWFHLNEWNTPTISHLKKKNKQQIIRGRQDFCIQTFLNKVFIISIKIDSIYIS